MVRLESGRSTSPCSRSRSLRSLVAIDLAGGDLRQLVLGEEGEEVMGEGEFVVLGGSRRELIAPRVQPLRGELVEGRLFVLLDRRRRRGRLPDPAPNIGEDVGELLLGLGP